LKPIEWSQAVELTRKATPYVGEILDAAFASANAVIVLLTGDDQARLKPDFYTPSDPTYEREFTEQARPNVLFEAGLALGRHPESTVLVQIGEIKPFSDVAGRHILRLNNSVSSRQQLALRLQSFGCSVDLNGVDWHTAGNLSVAKSSADTKDIEHQEKNGNIKAETGANIDEDCRKILLALSDFETRERGEGPAYDIRKSTTLNRTIVVALPGGAA
jgi:hypothetical protein